TSQSQRGAQRSLGRERGDGPRDDMRGHEPREGYGRGAWVRSNELRGYDELGRGVGRGHEHICGPDEERYGRYAEHGRSSGMRGEGGGRGFGGEGGRYGRSGGEGRLREQGRFRSRGDDERGYGEGHMRSRGDDEA